MKRALAILCASTLLVGAKVPVVPAVEGWTDASVKTVCAIRRGDVMLATQDADSVYLGLFTATPPTTPTVSTVRFGERSFDIVFRPAKGLVIGELSEDAFMALGRSGAVQSKWLASGAQEVGSIRAPVVALLDCARRLEVAAEKRRQFADKLMAAGAILQGSTPPLPRSSGASASQGFVCFKEREWTSGLNRNCVYSCTGSEAVQTIGVADICPITIER